MANGWLLLHALGPVAAIVAWTLAGVVYSARPRAAANRRLALLLAIEGSGAGVLGGLNLLEAVGVWIPETTASQSLVNFIILMTPGVYLLFLSTLDTWVVRPLRGRAGAVTFTVALLVLPGAWFVAGNLSFAGPAGLWHLLMLWLTFGGLYGLAASLGAYAKAGTQQRQFQARAYSIAFGIHDTFWIVGALLAGRLLPAPQFIYLLGSWGTPQLTTLLFAPVLAYGILKYQLLDIDLRLKRTVRGSTVAAAFVAVFFVASELAETFFSDVIGPYVGVLAAGLLVFAMAPLQGIADRLAERALPGVEATPEYLAFRKLEIYKGAVESAHVDGIVTDKERAVLDRLQRDLGIAAADAEAIERDATVTPLQG